METMTLAYPSSMAYWRSYGGRAPRPVEASFALTNEDPLPAAKRLLSSDARFAERLIAPDGKVHLIAPTGRRHRTDSIVCRTVNVDVPAGSFCRIDTNVYAMSPSWCFAHASGFLSLPQACLLANELCGTYVPAPFDRETPHRGNGRSEGNNRGNRGNRSSLKSREHVSTRSSTAGLGHVGSRDSVPYREPLVRASALEAYVRAFFQPTSRANGIRALSWSLEGCRSPAEAQVAVKLLLPFRYGAWNVQGPESNARIDITPQAQKLLGVPYCSCDFLWRDRGVGLEYYGEEEHSGELRTAHDWEREIVLRETGIEVIPMNALQLNNVQRFAVIARHLKEELGEQGPRDPGKHERAAWKLFGQIRDYERALAAIM